TASLAGPQGASGWYTGPVDVTLSAADNFSGVASTYYALDGGAQQTYVAPFSVSTEGSHTLTFFSVDQAGNAEAPGSLTFQIDGTPPAITLTLVGGAIIPANGKMVTIAGYGRISDALSGFDRSSARFSVVDDYGTVQPSGAMVLYPYHGRDLYYF